MKTEDQVLEEVINYINLPKYKQKRPCTLQSIKKELRTDKVINLIFSRPDVFHLSSELKHVPENKLSELILIKYVLSDPKIFANLSVEQQTIKVMIAYEFSKRRFEKISAHYWGIYREKLCYPENVLNYRNQIEDLCDKLQNKYNDEIILKDYITYIDKVGEEINSLELNNELKKEEKYTSKHFNMDLPTDRRVFILVSGHPDAGKTYFSNILANRFNNSICFDSDMLLEQDKLLLPLSSLIGDKAKVIVFSDVYAHRFFQSDDLGDAIVINILIKPSSIEKMYRNSKYMQNIPFEFYKQKEIESIRYKDLEGAYHIINDYTQNIFKEVDNAIEYIVDEVNNKLTENENAVLTKIYEGENNED